MYGDKQSNDQSRSDQYAIRREEEVSDLEEARIQAAGYSLKPTPAPPADTADLSIDANLGRAIGRADQDKFAKPARSICCCLGQKPVKEKANPRGRTGGPFMNPSYDGGNSPRFFRHFRTGGTSHTEPIFRVEPPVH